MNYIVFDLEWNQCPTGKKQENPLLPFEIIQIGAVKLNRNLVEIGRFQENTRPQVYTEFHSRTQEILEMRMEDFVNADVFPRVCRRFLDWCGSKVRYCTWGPLDLLELQRNMRYYGMENTLHFPLRYYDIQKLFSIRCQDSKNRRSLQDAVQLLSLPTKLRFHDALCDSLYTAAVLRTLDMDMVTANYSIDYFRTPANKKEEIHARFADSVKYISRSFSGRGEAMHDRGVTSMKCFLCHTPLKKEFRWFLGSSRNYFCLARCPQHGWLKGKIRIKKTESWPDRVFCIKTIHLISDEEALALIEKRASILEKESLREIRRSEKTADA